LLSCFDAQISRHLDAQIFYFLGCGDHAFHFALSHLFSRLDLSTALVWAMVSGLVIVLCSTLFHHGLYQVLRLGLVRRVCEPLVRRRTGRKDLTFSEGDVSHTAEL
jgi:hypothetical protein